MELRKAGTCFCTETYSEYTYIYEFGIRLSDVCAGEPLKLSKSALDCNPLRF